MKKILIFFAFALITCCTFVQNATAGGMLESFENIDSIPATGWQKWQNSSFDGWTNLVAGTIPMPGWYAGEITVPPCTGAGSRVAYVSLSRSSLIIKDNWMVSPKLSGINAASTLSFWWNASIAEHPDDLYLLISTNSRVASQADFNVEAWHAYLPSGFPSGGDYMSWSNTVVNIGSLVTPGQDIFIAFREYSANVSDETKSIQLDVIESDLWSAPSLNIKSVRLTSLTTLEIEYNGFVGYPAAEEVGLCWSSDPEPILSIGNTIYIDQSNRMCVISNFPNDKVYYLRIFAKHEKGYFYGSSIKISPGGSAGEGLLFESFENVNNDMLPLGWTKNQPIGGNGWTNLIAGTSPMPEWISGEITVPQCEGSGTQVAYVTSNHESSNTNDNWLISPQIKNIPPDYDLSFWWNSAFSNFADNIYVYLSTTGNNPSDFTTELMHIDLPKGYPADRDFMDWSNNVIDVSAAVPEGSDIYLAFREYCPNILNDGRANQLDVISAGRLVRNALYFDGIDDEIVLDLTLDARSDNSGYAIEAWVKPNLNRGMNIIVAKANSSITNFIKQLRMTETGQFQHYLWEGTVERYVTGTTIAQTGKWYHIVGTAENYGYMRLFVNGTEEGTAKEVAIAQITDKIYLGSPYGHSNRFFNGDLDEVRIWNFARTHQQILDSMNIYLRGIEDDLVGYYRFDNTFGNDIFDSSIQKNDSWFGSRLDSYTWNHQQTLFDGIDDYEVIPQNNIPPDYTIEAWVCPSDTSARNIMVFTEGNPMTSYLRQLRINSAGQFEFYSYDGTARLATSITTVTPGQWYYVVGTAVNGDKMRLYVNSSEEDYKLAGNTLWGSGYNQYQIGAASGGGFDWFKGRMYNVAITNYVKYDLEIENEYAAITITNNNPDTFPQWTKSEAPLGDYLAAKNYHNQAAWDVVTNNLATRGLSVETLDVSISNFVVFSDNNFDRTTDLNSLPLLKDQMFSRLGSVWYFDIHGATNQKLKLTFNPQNSNADFDGTATNNYKLLFRENETNTFAIVREAADSVIHPNVIFDNFIPKEGFYTLAGQDVPPPPVAQEGYDITETSFCASWTSSLSATNYYIDVCYDNAFTSWVPGYANKSVGNVLSVIITNLAKGMPFYYYRVRAENAAGISPSSGGVMVILEYNAVIGLSTNHLYFNSVYGTNPPLQTFVITNLGNVFDYSYSQIYGPDASGWLSLSDSGGTLYALQGKSVTAEVACASINVGTYFVSNIVSSGEAVNSPQSQIFHLTIEKAAANVFLDNLSQTYDGSAKYATATTDPGGLSLSVSYNGVSTAPVNVGEYAVTAIVNEINYQGMTNGILTIQKASQTISSFTPTNGSAFNSDQVVTLAASASSGLVVDLALVSGPAVLYDGNTLRFTGGGNVIVSATQAGNTNWLPVSVNNTYTITDNTPVHYVAKSGQTALPPYSSWETAATNIQDAVDVAIGGDSVIVSNGTYLLSSQIAVDVNLTIQSVNGFATTIIDGNNSVRCLSLHNHNTIISGFTITNGNAGVDNDGGGILCSDTTPVITNCVVIGNSAGAHGGGVCYGTVNNCTVSENTSTYDGGGVYHSIANNCLIVINSANWGGGTYQGTINNCTVSGNSATDNGGGSFFGTVNNSIVYYNSAPTFPNRRDGTYNYSCTTPDGTNGTENIIGPPEFISSPPYVKGAGGFSLRLQPTSPCINSGTNAFAPMPIDLDGNQRIIFDTVDMGAYEFTGPMIFGDALTFPSSNALVFASETTNITWNPERIADFTDSTNLTISKISLHYADTENWIVDVTNNIDNTLGEIEWYVPDGNWDNETNYILKFEVVNSSHITNSRFLSDNIFALVPEPVLIFNLCLLLIYHSKSTKV